MMRIGVDYGIAADWIAESASEDRIVWVQWDHDEAENLASACDDSVINGDVYEFWGADWRIHMHRCRGAR